MSTFRSIHRIVSAAAIIVAASMSEVSAVPATISACQAAKTKCVSNAVSCLLGCHAKAQKVGFLTPECVGHCRKKFDGALSTPPDPTRGCIQKLQARGDCLTADETSAMAVTIDAFVDDVVCALDPWAGNCAATASPTPIPSATPTPARTPTSSSDAKRVFLSSSAFGPGFGGLSGADAVCQGLAEAAGLNGIYLAWLSDGIDSPATRFTHSTAPYVLVDGVSTVANDWNDLTDGIVATAVTLTEARDHLGNVDVWTGTRSGGQSAAATCGGWTSTSFIEIALAGVAKTGILAWWTEYETLPCDAVAHLYCFEQ